MLHSTLVLSSYLLSESPFDRARLLANSVQVSIQGGHKEQAFRKGNGAGAAKPLQKHKAEIKEMYCEQTFSTYLMQLNQK